MNYLDEVKGLPIMVWIIMCFLSFQLALVLIATDVMVIPDGYILIPTYELFFFAMTIVVGCWAMFSLYNPSPNEGTGDD